MKSWKHAPAHPDVARYIDCYWFLAREHGDDGSASPKLNPDPAAHLILADPSLPYRYAQGGQAEMGAGSHWLFPHCHTFEMDHSSSFHILGVKFHIGALYSLDAPLRQPVLDRVVAADLSSFLLGSECTETALLQLAPADMQACCAALDAQLLGWLCNSYEDRHSQLVRRASPLLMDTVIAELGEVLHCSQRTLERSFQRVTGLTLKQCQSMERLELILTYLYSFDGDVFDWADIAQRFGFSDQPHLIRHFKRSIGATPGHYARQRDLTIDIYGDFEPR